ncbi:hypothetical protein LTS18_003501 [Coniosporium uncinatum]|uniref:Uncharacterized protein n=1 Tax=Coniosporium uncinatum TaxID=93489 RepID=A0ACC3DBH4_9PEZI|nr:hypothetical protein LTS18_003501 [Coniosporium uncinatum]
MKVTFFAAAGLATMAAAASSHATVVIRETPDVNAAPVDFAVDLNVLTPLGNLTTTSMKVLSAENVDINSITCRGYKDSQGTVFATDEFTNTRRADIATNPVVVAAVICNGSVQVSGGAHNGTSGNTTTITVPVSTMTSGDLTSTIFSTVTGPSTGFPSANLTTITTRPSNSATGTPMPPTSSPTPSQSAAPAPDAAGVASGVIASMSLAGSALLAAAGFAILL